MSNKHAAHRVAQKTAGVIVTVECRLTAGQIKSWTYSERAEALRFIASRSRKKKPPAWLEKRILKQRLKQLQREWMAAAAARDTND